MNRTHWTVCSDTFSFSFLKQSFPFKGGGLGRKAFCYCFDASILFWFTLSEFCLKQCVRLISKCLGKENLSRWPWSAGFPEAWGIQLDVRAAVLRPLFRPLKAHCLRYPLLSTETSRSCGMGFDPSTLYLDPTLTEDRYGGGVGRRIK